MENIASSRKATVVGLMVALGGVLLVLFAVIIAAGSRAFATAAHGADQLQVLERVLRLIAAPGFLLPVGAVGLFTTAAAGFTSGRLAEKPQPLHTLLIGSLTLAGLVGLAVAVPAHLPGWVYPLAIVLPIPFTFAGVAISKINLTGVNKQAVFNPPVEAVKQRTVQHIERDRESVEQYALVTSQRKQDSGLEDNRRTKLDERRELERARAESTARMRAIARAAFMSHPAATVMDFERCWPEIRDELFRQHTIQLLTESVAQVEELTPDIERTSAMKMLRLASGPQNSRGNHLLGAAENEAGETNQRAAVNRALSLLSAARDGNVNRLRSIIESGTDINVKNSEGWTPLMISVLKGHFETARLLVSKGASLEEKNNSGWTALRFASSIGDTEIMTMLVEHGADVNSRDEKGWTILMNAADEGNAVSVRVLLQYGVDKEARNLAHESALSLALRRGHADIVHMLKKTGAEKKRSIQ